MVTLKTANLIMAFEPKTVLVVDDEPSVRDLVWVLLSRMGHRVETAGNGNEALGKIEDFQFDLVFTDLSMPEMNGDQLAREIKKRRPHLPIVLLTGQKPEIISPEFSLVLTKPFSGSQLRETIDALT